VKLLGVMMQLFIQVMPAGMKILTMLLPSLVQLTADLVPAIVASAKLVAVVLQWLQHTHLLLPVLAVLAVAVLYLISPILGVAVGVAALIAIGLALAKHWRQIWHDILAIIDGVWSWIRGHWPLLLGILTGPVGLAVYFIVSRWSTVAGIFGRVMGAIRGIWNGVYGALISPVVAAYNAIAGWVSRIAGIIGSIPGMVNNALGGIPGKVLGMLGFEHGGITGAAGGGPRSGWTMVGEHGGELIRLAPGSGVHSNPDTERMLGQGGGPAVLRIEWGGGPSGELERAIWIWAKRRIRIHGGNPNVLGA
jgi:phage-related protein